MKLQLGRDGITVLWDFVHTGGLNITLVEILLRENRDDSSFVVVPGGNLSRPSNNSFLVSGSNLRAGLTYQIAVRASNGFGVSDLNISEPQTATVGMCRLTIEAIQLARHKALRHSSMCNMIQYSITIYVHL